ncbi:MAG TPA: hypothetical protein VFU22_21265, partial [Roseiflexaceae bacterium]|nr:hypothetical protein [Roseiflexaceae bacterium]
MPRLVVAASIALAACAPASEALVSPPPPASAAPSLSPALQATEAIVSSPAPAATAVPRPTPQPTEPPTVIAPPSPFAGTPAPVLGGDLITSTARLDIYQITGGLTITTLLRLAPRFEQAIDRVSERMGARLSGRVALSFEPAQRGPCALRGLTLSHQRTIRLYYAPDTPEER